jgi:antitoxin (DNA-binding transcriptional repressor) of toxin-antitoxin stability system
MDRYDITYAREHLPELMARAARGEDVSISDPEHGTFRLAPDRPAVDGDDAVIEPTLQKPVLGQWKGKLTVPERLFEPLSEEEMAWLSGEASK